MQCCVSLSSLSLPGPPSHSPSLIHSPSPTSVRQFDMYTHTYTVHHLPSPPLPPLLPSYPLKGTHSPFSALFYKRAEALQRSPGAGSCFRRLRGIYWFSLCLPWASLSCLPAMVGPGTSGKHRVGCRGVGDLSFVETLFLGTQRMIKATVNVLSRRKPQRKNRSRACDITHLGEAPCAMNRYACLR